MQSRIKEEFEFQGPFEFYTVGETFSGDGGLLASYISDQMLDGQFDFSLYWSILSAFARYESPLPSVEATYDASREIYGSALMSNYLGNHDVERFISHAAGEVSSLYGEGLCPDGYWRGPAAPPGEDAYRRLKLAWTWLLTHPGPALIYYGDEIGLPGYHDPDNRQFMLFDGELENAQREVHDHVQLLTSIRKSHREVLFGEKSNWWEEDDVLAVARSSADGASIVVINRGYEERTLSNGLSWANLNEGTYRDLLSGETFASDGDQLSLWVPSQSARILVWEE